MLKQLFSYLNYYSFYAVVSSDCARLLRHKQPFFISHSIFSVPVCWKYSCNKQDYSLRRPKTTKRNLYDGIQLKEQVHLVDLILVSVVSEASCNTFWGGTELHSMKLLGYIAQMWDEMLPIFLLGLFSKWQILVVTGYCTECSAR